MNSEYNNDLETNEDQYDRIKHDIRTMADNLFFGCDDGECHYMENIMKTYAKVCSALLIIIKSYVDDMEEHGRNMIKYVNTDHNIFNKWAYSTYPEKTYTDDECLIKWKSMDIELPFNLVRQTMAEKGYYIKVTEKSGREDLYAPVVTTYTVEIVKHRNRHRDD